MNLFRVMPFLLLLILSGHAVAGGNLTSLAEDAVFADAESSASAIYKLRAHKQKGLDAVFKRFRDEIDAYQNTGQAPGNWREISSVIDAVSRQKDGYSSRLFWHTDLNEARREAVRERKPIVSLRLLGKLSEEYSCANSRFFRSILYSDPAIAKNLRENFVLHWKSVRPAPKITIDFGDGRKLVRTITGNSIHYILSETGQIYDALPGLYDPDKFNLYLSELHATIKNGDASPTGANGYRLKKGREIVEDWRNKLALLGRKTLEEPEERSGPAFSQPNAIDAMPRAVTKMLVERPAVLALMPGIERLRDFTEIDDWKQLAQLDGPVRISNESLKMIRAKTGEIGEEEFGRLVRNLKEYIAIDTVQNEYRFHLEIMSWINSTTQVEPLNTQVYAKLFLTPDSDKWLGLYASDIYSAIENNGVVD